ncbi:MAG: 1-deoxy-D-xylulose-5-phosphate reductoisomerase, partial [Actinobacteria bacterium]|nr:1-deoxy-D-xylulose-5-phosphate reductoisomerase [Actinomycetota bacterium]
MRSVAILGSTGSVGTQALDVVRRHPDRFKVVGLSAAGANLELLAGQIREFLPPFVAIADESAAGNVKQKLGAVPGVEIIEGLDASERLADEIEADTVLNALVGSAGLAPTLAVLRSGKTLALANKESLVVGGELVTDLIKGEPERLLPVDSEHAALAMAMRGERREDIKRVVLTGSGGPFRGWTRNELARASVKEALQHPVWSMGPKITIDSATLMNKGLEVIEAHYLFDLEYSSIHVLIHPEGIVHAMAEFRDGSLRAEMASPDMRLPIQLALAWPERLATGVEPVPLTERPLTFEPVDR